MKAEMIKIGESYRCRCGNDSEKIPVTVVAKHEVRGWWVEPLGGGERIQVEMPMQFHEVYIAPDPNRCSFKNCDEPVSLTYLGKPYCQRHYTKKVTPVEAAGETTPETPTQENDMATKTKSGKSKKSKSKGSKATVVETTKPKSSKPEKSRNPDAAPKAKAATKEKTRANPAEQTPSGKKRVIKDTVEIRKEIVASALKVLKKSDTPLNVKEIYETMSWRAKRTDMSGPASVYHAIWDDINRSENPVFKRSKERAKFVAK